MSYKKEIELNVFRKLVYEKFGRDISEIKQIKAHASERKIYRLFAGDRSVIGVHNDNAKENSAFINFSKTFKAAGLNVPAIYGQSDDGLSYIEEDLGDTTLHNLNGSYNDKQSYYKTALSDLVRFQINGKEKINFSFCYQTEVFNAEVVAFDIERFNRYFGKYIFNKNYNDETTSDIVEFFRNVLEQDDSEYFLYRDFQPRNVMLKDNKLYYIDYQSGRKGPLHYDVASFLYSGSIDITDEQRIGLLNHYMEKLSQFIKVDEVKFKHYFYLFAFLRMLQVLGSYSYLIIERNDVSVTGKIKKAITNIEKIISILQIKILEKYIEGIRNLNKI